MDCNGSPHSIPALSEPVIVIFFKVMCCHFGVVAVTSCAESDEGEAGVSRAVADDESEVEYRLDFEAWEARTRKVMAAEKLLELASGYEEAFLLLDTIVVVQQGKQGHKQVAKARGAVAGYHRRVAAAMKEKEEGE